MPFSPATAEQHEAPAPIGEEAQPPAAGLARKPPKAVKQSGAGSGPRLNPVNIDPKNGAASAEAQLLREGESVVMRIVLILLLLCTPALAHDANHPELNEWFNRLTSGRGLYCSFADGFAVSDVDWESKDGHYRVRLGGQWIDIPDDALITEPNRVGRTMVWPLRFDGQIFVRCFMPGSMG